MWVFGNGFVLETSGNVVYDATVHSMQELSLAIRSESNSISISFGHNDGRLDEYRHNDTCPARTVIRRHHVVGNLHKHSFGQHGSQI
jgi:hypothetical protein